MLPSEFYANATVEDFEQLIALRNLEGKEERKRDRQAKARARAAKGKSKR